MKSTHVDNPRRLFAALALQVVIASCSLFVLRPTANAQPSVVSIGSDLVFRVNGDPVFPIGFTLAPPPEARSPSGEDAYSALAENGAVFHRCSVGSGQWGPAGEAELDRLLDRSLEAGIFCAIWIADLSAFAPGNSAKESELRRIVTKYRDHGGLGYWKGADEPDWGRVPVENAQRFADIVRELDPNHPVWITQAPRGTINSLSRYDPTYDVVAIDIYPIGYPPGAHGHLPNRNISMVGDYASWLQTITAGRKPFWMILQIAWSGVVRPGETLRFPTFPEERYMTYQSIIKGARGLAYFGGNLDGGMTAADRALGWNWRFYDKVLRPVLEELRPSAPLFPALVAPSSALPVQLTGASDVELLVRETDQHIYVLAAKREGSTVRARFSGLPLPDGARGDVLYEDPRQVEIAVGAFSDWFGPNEVHVYKFAR